MLRERIHELEAAQLRLQAQAEAARAGVAGDSGAARGRPQAAGRSLGAARARAARRQAASRTPQAPGHGSPSPTGPSAPGPAPSDPVDRPTIMSTHAILKQFQVLRTSRRTARTWLQVIGTNDDDRIPTAPAVPTAGERPAQPLRADGFEGGVFSRHAHEHVTIPPPRDRPARGWAARRVLRGLGGARASRGAGGLPANSAELQAPPAADPRDHDPTSHRRGPLRLRPPRRGGRRHLGAHETTRPGRRSKSRWP